MQLVVTPTGTDILCNGLSTGSVTLNVSGGTVAYAFNWSNGSTTQNITNLGAGPYSVTVTDANSCTANSSVTINQPTALTASISSQTNIGCSGGTTGSITIAGSGGTLPYTYSWSNGQNTATASNLIAGNYSATITDANSCTATINATITQQASLSASVIGTDPFCANSNCGTADLTVSGGSPPYSYNWSNGSVS